MLMNLESTTLNPNTLLCPTFRVWHKIEKITLVTFALSFGFRLESEMWREEISIYSILCFTHVTCHR